MALKIYMKHLNVFDWVALILLMVGGVNWGMIGVFNVDLVSMIFGVMSILSRAIYVLVGVSALYTIVILSTKTQ